MRTRMVKETRYKQVPVVKTRKFTVDVTKTRMRTEFRTISRKIPYKESVPYIVQVPFQVPIQIPVRTCRFVPKTITVPVSGCCPQCIGTYEGLNNAFNSYGQYFLESVFPGSVQGAGPAFNAPFQAPQGTAIPAPGEAPLPGPAGQRVPPPGVNSRNGGGVDRNNPPNLDGFGGNFPRPDSNTPPQPFPDRE